MPIKRINERSKGIEIRLLYMPSQDSESQFYRAFMQWADERPEFTNRMVTRDIYTYDMRATMQIINPGDFDNALAAIETWIREYLKDYKQVLVSINLFGGYTLMCPRYNEEE